MKAIRHSMLATLMCAMLAMPAHAQEMDMPPEEMGMKARRAHMEHKIKEIHGQLGLSEAQKQQLEENRKQNMDGMKAMAAQKRSLREAMKAELMKPNMDMAVVNDLQGKLKAIDAQQMDNHLRSMLEVRKILTPEQFAKFHALMEKNRRERRAQRDIKG